MSGLSIAMWRALDVANKPLPITMTSNAKEFVIDQNSIASQSSERLIQTSNH
jgi:hypothetical protein